MNKCSCGHYVGLLKPCACAYAVVTKYQKRVSCPMLDRIDIHVEVPRVDYDKLSGDRLGESSESIRKRVQDARDIQLTRFSKNHTVIVCNADMRVGKIRQFCKLQDEGGVLIWVEASEFDAGGDESDESVSESLSPHPETGVDDCRSVRRRRYPVPASGGGVAISSEVDVWLDVIGYSRYGIEKTVANKRLS